MKFTVEQNLKPDAGGGSSPFFRMQLDRIETPDKLTVVMHFKNRVWEVPSLFTQFVGYQNIVPKKYLETAGEEKAALHPIGTGPYHHVEGRQGDFHRFEAVANHWRKTPDFKELVIRRIPDPATRLTGLRAGEIDIGIVFGDYLDQAHEVRASPARRANAACYWVILSGQTTSDKEDYCPTCPWAGDPQRSEEPRERAQGPAGDESRRQQEGDHQRALEGQGLRDAVLVLLLSVPQGLPHGLEDPALRSGAREEAPGRSRDTPAASRSA